MQKPKGRIPILTKALPSSRLKELLDAIGRALREKNRVYWVCPLITESDVLELAPA